MKGKIPSSAKRVFQGVIFDVYQWPQKLFNGESVTFEKIKRQPSVQVIPVQGKKILLTKEEQAGIGKFYGLVGGVCERGEKTLAAAKREMLEETGFKAKQWQLYRVEEAGQSNKIEWVVHYYIAKDLQRVAGQTLDPGEKIQVLAVDFDKFIKMVLRPDFRSTFLTLHILRLMQAGKLAQFKKELFR